MEIVRAKILLVDDEKNNLVAMSRILSAEAYHVEQAQNGKEALDFIAKNTFDLIITDLRMPGMNGLELLRSIRTQNTKVPVILLSAYGTIDDAVEAMRFGAVNFLAKPINREQLLNAIHDALVKSRLNTEFDAGNLIGQCASITEMRRTIRILAPTNAAVLITGESGTGKEVVARLIHLESARKGRLVSLNCAAIPENLLESELFGYEKGAFTGAGTAKVGLFEQAEGGTLFLDEIGEMPTALQVKLLRVLEDGTFYRLGSTQPRRSDVRIVSATNANLRDKISSSAFREDLFYRLNVVSLHLEPLRNRGNDALLLALHFFAEFQRRYGKSGMVFSPETQEAILSNSWSGNIRELKNAIEKAVVLSSSLLLQPKDLGLVHEHKQERDSGAYLKIPPGLTLAEIENFVIKQTLDSTGGDKNSAAKILGINVRTIYRKIDAGL